MAIKDLKCSFCNNPGHAHGKRDDSGFRPILCFNHWKQSRAKTWNNNSKKRKAERHEIAGDTDAGFLMNLIHTAPDNCQNCNESLLYWKRNNDPTICAHILEKARREFWIVSANKKNIVFICASCHHSFDNSGEDWFEKQNQEFKKLIRDRVKYLKNFLTEAQKTHIKTYLDE